MKFSQNVEIIFEYTVWNIDLWTDSQYPYYFLYSCILKLKRLWYFPSDLLIWPQVTYQSFVCQEERFRQTMCFMYSQCLSVSVLHSLICGHSEWILQPHSEEAADTNCRHRNVFLQALSGQFWTGSWQGLLTPCCLERAESFSLPHQKMGHAFVKAPDSMPS